MDKYLEILENYDGDIYDLLYDYDISNTDLLHALDLAGMIDIEELYVRMRHGLEEEFDS